MKRVLDVARIQLMSWTAVLAYPLGVVASLVVLGLAIDVANGDGAFSERPIILLPTAALLAGIGVLVTSQGWWPAVGDFFTGQPTLAIFAGYPLVIALILGGTGWLAIRRATP